MPLIEQGQALAPYVSAMMDVSDGLLLDAARMARASGATLAIDRKAVPIATPEARRDEALRWGDDYQLLFTLAEGTDLPCPAHRIGEVRPASDASVLIDGQPPAAEDPLGFQHSQKTGR